MKRAFACAAALAALFTAPAASAQDADVAFNIGIFQDYVFRGFSQTSEDPAIQGGVDLTAGSFYAAPGPPTSTSATTPMQSSTSTVVTAPRRRAMRWTSA